jgi:hypothetical protein
VSHSHTTLVRDRDRMAAPDAQPPDATPPPESLFPEARQRQRHRRWIIGGVALLLVAAAFSWVLLSGGGHPPHKTASPSVHPRPPVVAKTHQRSGLPTSCTFGPTPGFLEGTVKQATATTVGVSAGTACTDNFPVGPTTSVCWGPCGAEPWTSVWSRLTPEDVVDVQASTDPEGSITVDWIDVDSLTGQGVVTSVPAPNEVTVQLTGGRSSGTDTLLIAPSTIVEKGSAQTLGSSGLVQVGDSTYFTGSAVGPGPNTPEVYAARIFIDT